MRAIVYKSLSNKGEETEIEAGKTLAENFPYADFKKTVAIVNGKIEKKEYIVNEGDVIAVRILPGPPAVVIALTIVLLVAGGVACGIALYKAKKAREDAEAALEDVKKQSNTPQIDNRPFLRGASNTLATGNSQPYICGRHFFTPYIMSGQFYDIQGSNGETQYVNMVFECGFSPVCIESVSIEDVEIFNSNSDTPQDGAWNLISGPFSEGGRIEIAQGRRFNDLYNLNTKYVSTVLNKEVPLDSKVARGDADYLTFTLDEHARNVAIVYSFPYGLYAYNDEGRTINALVVVTAEYSLNGGGTWNEIRSVNRNHNAQKELRFEFTKPFTLDNYRTLYRNNQRAIMVRVRISGSDDPKVKNTCYVLYYQSECFDPELSSSPAGNLQDATLPDERRAGLVPCRIVEDRELPYCTMIALRVKATESNKDKLKKVNVIAKGVARTWDRERKEWSVGKTFTRNPAAWALEILTSPCHPLSRFADSEIDLAAFGDFYEHCENKNYNFDYVITQNAKKSSTLNLIMESCGAALYWDINGRISVAIDRIQQNAIAVYNAQNIINISNKKKFGRRTDGLRIRYTTSHNDLFTEDTYLLMRDGCELNSNSIIKDITIKGVTEYAHVVKYARRLMAIEVERPKVTTIEVGNEGVCFIPYSKVLLQDDSLKIGLGSGVITDIIWRAGVLTAIRTEEFFTFESWKRYGIIVNCYGENRTVPLSLEVEGEGYTNVLNVATYFNSEERYIPEPGFILSFGEITDGGFGKITTEYLINNISQSNNGFRLELVNYNPNIYSSGNIPDYTPNITQKPAVSQDSVPPDYVTSEELTQAIATIPGVDTTPPSSPEITGIIATERGNARITFSRSTDDGSGVDFYQIWRSEGQDGESWSLIGVVKHNDSVGEYTFANTTEQKLSYYRYAVSAMDKAGNHSEKSTPFLFYSAVSVRPLNLVSVAATASRDSIALSWVQPATDDTALRSSYFVVEISRDGGINWGRICSTFSEYTEYMFDRTIDGYPEKSILQNYRFRVKGVSAYRNETDWFVANVDTQNYLTWKIPDIDFSATATKGTVHLEWQLANNRFYGEYCFDVFLNNEKIAENIHSLVYRYKFLDFLEKEDVEAMRFALKAKTEADEKEAQLSGIDTSSYKTWIVEPPEVSAVAEQNGIRIAWKKTNDFYGNAEYKILIDGNVAHTAASEGEWLYKFPENSFYTKEQIEALSLKVALETEADSAETEADIDTADYKGWTPSTPELRAAANGRMVSLSWNSQDVYGFSGCAIQVAKAYRVVEGVYEAITDSDDLEWFAPAMGLNCYASEDNYKLGDAGGLLEVKGLSVSFSVPLYGQAAKKSVNTLYAYRAAAKTPAGQSPWCEPVFVDATATSAQDIVDNAVETAKIKDGAVVADKIFVEELAAISANLGFINDGAMQGNQYNYWAIGDTQLENGSMLWRGSFRVGGSDQYIEVRPRLNGEGTPTGEYDIEFVVGTYRVAATGETSIRGKDFKVYDTDGNIIFMAGESGNLCAVDTGEYTTKKPYTQCLTFLPITVEQLDRDSFGNLSTEEQAEMVSYFNKQIIFFDMEPIEFWHYKEKFYAFFCFSDIILILAEINAETASARIVRIWRLHGKFSCTYTDDQWGRVFICKDSRVFLFSSESGLIDELYVLPSGWFALAISKGVFLFNPLEHEARFLTISGSSIALPDSLCDVLPTDNTACLNWACDNDIVYAAVTSGLGTFFVKLDLPSARAWFHFTPMFYTNIDMDYSRNIMYDHNEIIMSSVRAHFENGFLWWVFHGDIVEAVDGNQFSHRALSALCALNVSELPWYEVDSMPNFSLQNHAWVARPDIYPCTNEISPIEFPVLLVSQIGAGFVRGTEYCVSEFIYNDIVRADADTGSQGEDIIGGVVKAPLMVQTIFATKKPLYSYTDPNSVFYMYSRVTSMNVRGKTLFCMLFSNLDDVPAPLIRNGIAFFAENEDSFIDGREAFKSGAGFVKILYDAASEHYRYYLDANTGCEAFLEFDGAGNLVSAGTQGPQGRPGRDGVGIRRHAVSDNPVLDGEGNETGKRRMSLDLEYDNGTQDTLEMEYFSNTAAFEAIAEHMAEMQAAAAESARLSALSAVSAEDSKTYAEAARNAAQASEANISQIITDTVANLEKLFPEELSEADVDEIWEYCDEYLLGVENWNHYVALGYITIKDGAIAPVSFCYTEIVGNLVIPGSVTSIGEDAFRYCTSLESVVIPNSVTSIGEDAFWACTSLKSVVIPNSVTSIGVTAFQYCTSLEKVVIPGSVTSIAGNAFDRCTSLESVVFENPTGWLDNNDNPVDFSDSAHAVEILQSSFYKTYHRI